MQPAYQKKYQEPSIEDRLNAVNPDLTEELFRSAVSRAYVENCLRFTSYNPPSALGQTMYIYCTGNVREALTCLPGWRCSDAHNICRCIHDDSGITIICSSGNEYTGLAEYVPSTRAAKGSASAELVNQMCLFDLPEYDGPIQQVWYLLTYVDFEKNEIRCELALPRLVSKDKQIDDWAARIILSPIDIGHAPEVSLENDQADEAIDVPVEIKKVV